ncbi:SpoIIE family protein phosphatase [Streptomyces sp. NPDC015220]|uniref:SpoIIE family protein phosphatase n=1 Tax=Streptomyces sp. NPDC015220 TaxID=3364947 RepID=UPI00370239D0
MSPVYPFDDAATARAVVDERGAVVEWNEGARRLLGWAPQEVLARPAARLLADGARRAVPREPRWTGTLALRHRDGHTVPVWVLAHHRRPEDGGDWLLVTPLPSGAPPAPDDPLAHVLLVQSPCAVAVYDDRLRLHAVNDAMAEVIGLPGERLRGLRHSEIGGRSHSGDIEEHMLRVLGTGRGHDVRTYVPVGCDDRMTTWLARMSPIKDAEGRVQGVCVAVHDFTEQARARERLQLVNEASVRIGTTLDVTRTAQELADVCVPSLADLVGVYLVDPPGHGGELPTGPLQVPVSLRRVAHRSVTEAGVPTGRSEVYPAVSPQGAALLTGQTIVVTDKSGRDLENWLAWDPERGRLAARLGVHSTMSVPVLARGVTLGVAVFTRFEQPAPFMPDDVLLAEEVTARAAVCIDNARRYSRERETALALQRSLLPRTLPRTAAVQAASRYLPAARADVGGDWFDVIPLSGMRVALVVGDVIGHGVRASAAMGRLRTAVRTLADIDLAPDELLTHLDDVVVRMSAEAGDEGGGPGEVGATCLYAVYDPVSRRCTLARAGHPSPVLVPPDGPPHRIEMPPGPPLGLGGLPFESIELDLREGSVLSFYTDGLLESRERDVEAGQRLLCEALAGRADSLDETCDRILRALLPRGSAGDDVALLLARTRGLPAAQVATWDIPADPSLVAPIRKQVVEQLDDWGLSMAAFTAELVVSELVTNAIRYATPPIRLRLIHDETHLICEVSDTSNTAPHLRRAKTWDEGGRGLLLVAQLTQRWGSRHTLEGKTIWAELSLLHEE